MSMSHEWVSVGQYAKINNVSKRTIYNWIHSDKIPTKIVTVEEVRIPKNAKPKYKRIFKQHL